MKPDDDPFGETLGVTTSGRDSSSTSLPGLALGACIGRGGMGEVILGHDEVIGRDVAIKRIRHRANAPVVVERFLREARIQARLEHPSIVPVHALGRDAAGDPYFTMKRLSGLTLADALAAAERPTLQELLRTIVDVGRAIELAHARGVVHRDLKPQNVMLGDFGEVYVLDWGVARIVDETEAVGAVGDVVTLDGLTEAGALFGTPGYMAPEQAEAPATAGPPADVYALGAILFEILSGESLHPRGPGALPSTLAGVAGSPARRAPDRAIPPELDDLCVRALDHDPARRPTVQELGRSLQQYLDGDRDHERRRLLASAELGSARSLLATPGRRADAIRSAGRALALDPESRDAAALITQLLLEPPREAPPALARSLAISESSVQRRQGRAAALSLCVAIVFLLVATLDGARDGTLLAVIVGYTCGLALLAWHASRRAATPWVLWSIAIGNAVLAALLSRVFGSLIVAPLVTCVMAVSLTSYPQLRNHTHVVIALLVASWLTPVALEYAGILQETWRVEDGAIVSMSSTIDIGGPATTALLIGANVLAIGVIGLFANALARARHTAQRDVEIQAWQLRQLLPEGDHA